MARETFTSIETTVAQSEALLAQGRFDDAERELRELVAQTHVIDYEYDDWLRRLADVYRRLGHDSERGYIYLYLHYFDNARDAFASDDHLDARARVFDVEKRWHDAAELYRQSGRQVHAAVAYDRGSESSEAASVWGELGRSPRLRSRPYELALVHFNYGTSIVKTIDDEKGGDAEKSASRKALIDAQRRLEQVADDFELRGERERAFDCYQILLKLGKDSGQFENLAEGYLNCIRVLKEDGLKFYVLQYYEDFVELALQRSELHAAATLCLEAADYAAQSGLPYDRHYQLRAAETWAACARKFLADGVPLEMVENAMLAAISSHSAVGSYAQVRRLFEELAELEISEKKRDRFWTIAERYPETDVSADEMPAFPEYLKQQHAYADIWFVDLLEWELEGNPHDVAASIVGDLRYPDGIRRRALVVILTIADAVRRRQEGGPETLASVAELLGELQVYAALRPLEQLYEHESPEVRRAAIRALRFLFFKRSFVLLRRGLSDRAEEVRAAAVEALRGLHFPHAFNPLVRIYRETVDVGVKTVALESIGKIQSIEAGEMLLSVLRQEDGELREVAKQALASFDNAEVLPILRQYYDVEANPEVREVLASLLAVTTN